MIVESLPSLVDGRSVVRGLRFAFVVVLSLTVLSAGHSFLTHETITNDGSGPALEPAGGSVVDVGGIARSPVADPLVVATVDGVGPGQIVAYDADGSVVYHDASWMLYHDVDPSPRGAYTVTYVASGPAAADTCPGETCLRNVIERVNLTTGEVTRIHAWSDTRSGSSQIHDVDRVNESVFLVADISYPDRVYMIDVTSGEIRWEWRASEAFEPESGGSYPSDWTHLNDVEYLPDGRVMIGLRNQDQVVFIDPGSGLQEEWTLGRDDDHDVLYEAHNPDYIPAERGGPAVLVADSENNRLVEYQRVAGGWERTWHWQDVTMQWPRDADRLPSGRTIVVDSHGQRILSVRPNGTIAWSHEFPTGGYDVEVLGTGDESTGGSSAETLHLASRGPGSSVTDGNASMRASAVAPGVVDEEATPVTPAADGAARTDGNGLDTGRWSSRSPGASVDVFVYSVVSLVPPLVLHGLLYALPTWAGAVDAVLLLATTLVGTTWVTTVVGMRLLARFRTAREH